MSTPYVAPEVRAARRGAEIIPVRAPVGPDVDALLSEMIDADEVHIVGVLPWECSRRLIELQKKRIDANDPPPAKTVHYFIPERDAKSTGATMGPRIQRWVAGLFGVRNWVVPHRDESANRDTLVIHLYGDDPGGRLVLTRKGDRYRATTLLYLPAPRLPAEGVLTIASFDPAQTEKIREQVFTQLLPYTREWQIRQVRCYGPQYEDTGDPNSFTPRIWRLTKERKLQPKETEPAVVVAVCGQTWEGPVVVLKRRHRSNAIDDFDTLSLISEHVIVDDLVSWIKKVPHPLDPDDTQAREQIWRAAGRPKRLMLQQEFFEEAAQRELFLSCGLNVDFGRLDLCGHRLVEREDGTHLGFAVFRLDLIQEDALDELEIVKHWSADLAPILIDRLYDEHHRLNRLLRMQRGWLMTHVFDTKPPAPAGAVRQHPKHGR
jgi:hypothetical protein